MNTLTRKILMATTGLFLSFFLLIHFLGNTQLFLNDQIAQHNFNAYSHFLSGNPIIKLVSYVLYFSIIGHVVYAIIITIKNKKSSGKYNKDNRGRASKWYKRNMGVLGTIILIFLVMHFQNFWYVYKFGEIGIDPAGNKDLYSVVINAFQELWIVIFYVIAMVALFYHLIHGLSSGIRTLGLFHPKYVRMLQIICFIYSVIICLGFALMPIYIYITH